MLFFVCSFFILFLKNNQIFTGSTASVQVSALDNANATESLGIVEQVTMHPATHMLKIHDVRMASNVFDNITYEYIPVVVIMDGMDVPEMGAFQNMTVEGLYKSVLYGFKSS